MLAPLFESHHGEAPAGRHVVNKPGRTSSRQAVREPAQPRPLNATKPGSQPARPGQWRLPTSRRLSEAVSSTRGYIL